MVHPGRSSMFCTSFRRDIFNKLPKDNDRGYLDLAWWKYAEKNVKSKLIDKDIALGIKHGSVFGKTGGNGHHMFYETVDTSLNLLKKLVDDESFEFYRSLRDAYMNDFKLTITNYKRNR